MIQEILERLSDGETLVSIFSDKAMPTKRAFNKWRVLDEELDRLVFFASLRGYQVHADMAVATQLSIMDGKFKGDARQAQAAVTAANNLGHQSLAKLSKLDGRYKDKQQVEHVGPMVIGWADEAPVDFTEARKAVELVSDEFLDAITPEHTEN
jgi:hypothetical protein